MKKLVPVLMVVLAALCIAAVYLWQELSEVRSQTSELQSHITAMQSARLAAASSPALPAAVSGLQTAAAAVPPGLPAGTAPATPGATVAANRDTGRANDLAQQLLGTPEGREMMLSQLRMMLPRQYPDLGSELGLTPAETEKFLDMLAKHQLDAAADALSGNDGQRDAAAAQERQRRAAETQRTNQAEVAAMLGDKASRWQEYQQTLPLRQQVNQLKTSLGSGNNALNDAQSRQLIAALAAEQSRIQQERVSAPRPQQQAARPNPQAAMEQQLERSAENNRRMVSAASSYLNSQQLESYRKMLEQRQNLERTMMRSMSSQMGNPGPANGQSAAAPAGP